MCRRMQGVKERRKAREERLRAFFLCLSEKGVLLQNIKTQLWSSYEHLAGFQLSMV